MHGQGHPRTLISEAPRERRIWPWLVLLLVISVGGSFAAVFAFISYRASKAAASASAGGTTAVAPTSPASVVPSSSLSPVDTTSTTVATASAPNATTTTTTSLTNTRTNGVSATPAATHAPPPTVALDPPTVPAVLSKTPTSGVRVNGTSSEVPDCSDPDREGLYASKDAVAACFQQAHFDPPEHESTGYVVWIETDGKPTTVERLAQYPSVPRLDNCIAGVVRAAKFGKQKQRCWVRFEYTAQCVPGFAKQCKNVGAAASAAASAIPSGMTSAITPFKSRE